MASPHIGFEVIPLEMVDVDGRKSPNGAVLQSNGAVIQSNGAMPHPNGDIPQAIGLNRVHPKTVSQHLLLPSDIPTDAASMTGSETKLPVTLPYLRTKSREAFRNPKSVVKSNLLLISTMVAVALATIVGACIVNFPPKEIRHNVTDHCNVTTETRRIFTPREVAYISMPGNLFLRSLKMIILPLVVSSIISGFSNLDAKASRKLASTTFALYLGTTFLAGTESLISIISVRHLLRPGQVSNCSQGEMGNAMDNIIDLIKNLVPTNLVAATFRQASTTTKPWHYLDQNGSSHSILVAEEDFSEGSNILGLVVFSAVVGLICSSIGKESKPITDFFCSMNAVIMKLIEVIMVFSPMGVFFLILGEIVKRSASDLSDLMSMVGGFVGIVLVVMTIHALVTLPLIYFVATRKNPFRYMAGLSQAILTAFATSSSSATLAVTMKCVQRNGVDRRVAQFVLPIGANINMDGSCIYYTIAAVFCAQLEGLNPSVTQMITIAVVAALVSIGESGTPSAGMVYFIMILNAADLPTTYVGLIYAVDWFLDRFITASNVGGDALVVGIVNHFCGDVLPQTEVVDVDVDVDIDEDKDLSLKEL